MIIKLKTEFGNDFISRLAGERLRKRILEATDNVVVDFEKQIVASISFLDEAFAKLIDEGWSKKKIEGNLKLKNIHSRDEKLIQDLINSHISELKKK